MRLVESYSFNAEDEAFVVGKQRVALRESWEPYKAARHARIDADSRFRL